jgi:exosortase
MEMERHENQPSGAPLDSRCWRVALAALWFWTFWILSPEWRLNEQYQYGFAVPFAAAYLFWNRLQTLPPATGPNAPVTPHRLAAILALTAGYLFFFFAELLHEQDPSWRLVGWIMMASVTWLTLVWLWVEGGLRLVRALAWPIAFAWLALPWPSAIEMRVTLNLMHLVTGATVQLLNLTGVAALQHANVIELSRGLVGVDTACSGVQSFQSSLMVALFLGEALRLTVFNRAVLLGLSWTIALGGNFARVYVLARAMNSGGQNEVERWHNPTGLLATLGTFAAIALLARFLSGPAVKWEKPVSGESFGTKGNPRLRLMGIALLAGTALIPALTWAWFKYVPQQGLSVQRTPLWVVTTRELSPKWTARPDPFTPQENAILRFSAGQSYVLTTPSGGDARLFHLFWRPEVSVPNIAFSHAPDICMASAGWDLTSPPQPETLEINGRQFPCALYYFRIEGEEAAVIHGIWLGGTSEVLEQQVNSVSRLNRFGLLFTGPRRQGREMVTAVLPAVHDPGEQLRQFRDFLEMVLRPGAEGAKN